MATQAQTNTVDFENIVQLLDSLVEEGNNLGRRLSHIQQSAERAGLLSAQRLAQLQKAYVRLLWDSREVAGATQGTVDDFRSGMMVLIEDAEIEKETKIEEIDGWIEDTRKQSDATKAHPLAFRRLVEDIRGCLEKIESEVVKGTSQDRLSSGAKIPELRQTLRGYEEKLSECSTVTTTTPRYNRDDPSLGSNLLADLAYILLYPLERLKGIILFIVSEPRSTGGQRESRRRPAIDDSDDRETRQRDLRRKRDRVMLELRETEADVVKSRDLAAIAGVLNVIADDIEKFYPRLSMFSQVSSRLVEDMQRVKTLLLGCESVQDDALLQQTHQFKNVLEVESRVLGIYCRAPVS